MNALTNFIVMSIISGIAAVGLYFSDAMGDVYSLESTADVQIQDAQTIAKCWRNAYVFVQGGYPNVLDPNQCIKSGQVPTDIVNGATILTRTNQQAISGAGINSGATFTVTFPGIPDTQCAAMLQQGTMGGNYTSVTVSGGTARNLPITNATFVTTDCANGTESMVYTARGR